MLYSLSVCAGLVLGALLAPIPCLSQLQAQGDLGSSAMSAAGQMALPTITTLGNTGIVVTPSIGYDQSCHPQQEGPAVVRYFDMPGPSMAIHTICRTSECGQLVHTPAILRLNSFKENDHGPASQD